MKLSYIDKNNDFDFGKTSENYARFRDIYPESMYEKLIAMGIGKEGQQILDLGSGTAILPMNLYHTCPTKGHGAHRVQGVPRRGHGL